ncbi:MAG: uroporphyrinogen decarboxylase family protein [Spirochaetaceae bacterium]
MTGKELVLSAMENKTTERTPYVPFVGVHAAQLLDMKADEYLQSGDNIVAGVSKAIELYNPDGIPVIFDLQIEAEVFGSSIIWSEDNPPAVSSHPLMGDRKLSDLPEITEESGRIPMAMDVTRRLRKSYPDVALYGLITGPFTLSLHLMGPEIFMTMYDDPDYVKEMMEFCTETAKKMASWYMENGCDIIAVVDPMTSQIGPKDFSTFVSEYITEVFSHIRKAEKKSSFFVCGHAQKNIENMCLCKPDNISIDENIPLDYVKETTAKYDVSFGGNMKLTTVMLFENEEENVRHAAECISVGGNKGFILAPGCDIPYHVRPENIIAVSEMVRDEYKLQVAMELIGTKKEVTTDLDLSEYGGSDKIMVDIITLDSESCSPCQYMVESVKEIAPEFEGVVEWKEHKIKSKEAIELMVSLNVEKVPTICIDGKVTFISQIPKREDLIAAIYRRMIERARIKKNDSKLIVLDNGTSEAEELIENINRAQRELGSDIFVERITSKSEISQHGVKRLPAVISVKKELRSFGKVVDKDVVKEWIKMLS